MESEPVIDYTREEQDWIALCEIPVSSWLALYARAFNTRDLELLGHGLAPSVAYESQSVFDRITGKRELLRYWKGKFRAISHSNNKVVAELGRFPDGQPCALLFQASSEYDTNWLDSPLAAMTAKSNASGEIESLLMITCCPDPRLAYRSGIYPGLTGMPTTDEKRFVRATPKFDDITLYVFYLDGKMGLDCDMAETVAQVKREIDGINVVELNYRKDNCDSEWSAFGAFRLQGFPSVGAMFKGQPIYRHVGLIGAAELAEALRKAAPIFVAA